MTAALVAVGGVVLGAAAATAVGWYRVQRSVVDALRRLEPDSRPEPRWPSTTLDRLDEVARMTAAARHEERRRDDRLRAAFDALPQPVLVGDPDGVIVTANAAAVREEELGHTWALVRSAIEEVHTAGAKGRPLDRELSLFGPPRRQLVVRGLPLGDPAEPLGAIAVVDDVTERVRVDSIRRDFVANISHELRTPIGALALLAETLLDEDDAAVRDRLLQRIHDEAHRLGHIVDDLLDLSTIEAEDQPARKPEAVSNLFAEALDRVRATARLRDTKLIIEPATDSVAVLGDRRQLVRALVNLLENSIKYSPEGSEVRVAADVAVPDFVDLRVIDHGIGIPSRELDRVFERFYRVDHARSRATGGTGLGLSIVSHVAQNHGGVAIVESVEGEGSTFTLRIPAASIEGTVR